MTHRLSLLPLTLLLGTVATAQDPPAAIDAELAAALARAQVHNKRVLVVLDADDGELASALKKTRTVSRQLLYEFETVAVGRTEVPAIAARMQLPSARTGLAVLAADGVPRAWIAAASFGGATALDGDRLLAMLKPHFCAPVDAEQKLAAALVEAKRTGRNVFVRFDAPW